jgi:uncharacterized protein (UPF0335 family)
MLFPKDSRSILEVIARRNDTILDRLCQIFTERKGFDIKAIVFILRFNKNGGGRLGCDGFAVGDDRS